MLFAPAFFNDDAVQQDKDTGKAAIEISRGIRKLTVSKSLKKAAMTR